MFYSIVEEWFKKWDARRTIYLLLIVDAVIMEVQVLRFCADLVWKMRDAYMLQSIETITSSDEDGLRQFPSYQAIRVYFVVIGALTTRIFTNWVLFDGLVTGLTSHIRAGIMGTACTTLYITVGGFIFWIIQFVYFKLYLWLMVLMLVGFTGYAFVSVCVLTFVWREQASGALQMEAHHVSASIILVCGIFVGFVHLQIISWILTIVFNFEIDYAGKTFVLMKEGPHCFHGPELIKL